MTQSAISYNTPEGLAVLASLYPDMPEARRDLFARECDRTQLDPVARQIYAVERTVANRKVWATQVSIDGFRLIAQRSQEYAGQVGPHWCGKDGKWKEVWTETDYPFAARVGVHRKGFIEPLFAVAKFDSYVGKNSRGEVTTMWDKFAETMIGKCAEALALRRAFPAELSGLYSSEEMDQATRQVSDAPADDKALEKALAASLKAAPKASDQVVGRTPGCGHEEPQKDCDYCKGTTPNDLVAAASFGSKGESISEALPAPGPTQVAQAPAADDRGGLDRNQDADLAMYRASIEGCATPEELTAVGARVLKIKDSAVKTLAQAAFKAYRESKGWVSTRQADGSIMVSAR